VHGLQVKKQKDTIESQKERELTALSRSQNPMIGIDPVICGTALSGKGSPSSLCNLSATKS
jgi:hypothetical protein